MFDVIQKWVIIKLLAQLLQNFLLDKVLNVAEKIINYKLTLRTNWANKNFMPRWVFCCF